jgi:hypothetical protein
VEEETGFADTMQLEFRKGTHSLNKKRITMTLLGLDKSDFGSDLSRNEEFQFLTPHS